MSLEELLAKSPSQQYNLILLEKNISKKQFKGIVNNYMFASPDKSVKKNVINKKIFAVVQNGDTYVNCKKLKLNIGYEKILDIGKYWILEAASPQGDIETVGVISALYAGVPGVLATGAFAGRKRYIYLFDPQKNVTLMITRKKMDEILKEEALLAKYEAESDPRDIQTILKYVILANKLE